jgi:hypothetical protein
MVKRIKSPKEVDCFMWALPEIMKCQVCRRSRTIEEMLTSVQITTAKRTQIIRCSTYLVFESFQSYAPIFLELTECPS